MAPNLPLFFSLAALVLALVGSVDLLSDWLFHKRRFKFMLYFGAGLFLLFWYKLPGILAGFGYVITLKNFGVFFAVSFSASLWGYYLIFLGIASVVPVVSRGTRRKISWWFFPAVAVFWAYFLNFFGFGDFIPIWVLVILFYLPIQLVILAAFLKWVRLENDVRTAMSSAGLTLLTLATLFLLVASFLYLYRLAVYPPQFWFIAATSTVVMSVLQSAGMILMVLGFFAVHAECLRGKTGPLICE